MHRKLLIILIILTLFLPAIQVKALRQPIGIAGYVLSGSTPVSGASVTVINLATNENDTATTDSNGLYTCSLYGQDGDIIQGTATYKNQSGTTQTFVNLNYSTQWLNITLGGDLVARFSYYPLNPKPNEQVTFIDRSDGNIASWIWHFGDGTTATGKNTAHTYTEEGNYTVTLEIRDSSNNFDRTSQVIHVRTVTENPFIPPIEQPTYPFGYTIQQVCELLRITNMSKSTNSVTVVFIDSGVSDRKFQVNTTTIDLSKIIQYSATGTKTDNYGHGTAVGSILLYTLQSKLTNFKLICIKSFDSYGQSSERTFLDAMEMARKLHPDIVSISAGAIPTSNNMLSKEASKLTSEGIVVVASAGNSGSDLNTILSPAINPSVIAVGAEDPQKTIIKLSDDTICKWSSRGSPTLKKPDTTATGESIRLPWGKTQERVMSGTSFSTPFVAGGIAIAISENRGLYDLAKTLYFWDGTIVTNTVKQSLQDTCYPKGVYYEWGSGIAQFNKMSLTLSAKLSFLIFAYITLIFIIVVGIVAVLLTYKWKRKWW